MSVTYVNVFGDPVSTVAPPKVTKKAAPKADKFHKGWSVTGVDPERVTMAQEDHEARMRRNGTATPFDADKWIKDAPLKPARTKPFEVESSAYQCAELARKAGWHRVTVRCLSSAA